MRSWRTCVCICRYVYVHYFVSRLELNNFNLVASYQRSRSRGIKRNVRTLMYAQRTAISKGNEGTTISYIGISRQPLSMISLRLIEVQYALTSDCRGWAKELSIGRPCSKGSTSSMRKKDLDRELVRVVSNYSTTLSKEDPKRACCTERAASQNDLDGLDGDTIFAEEDRGAYCYVHGSLQHILKSYSETKERSTFQNSLRRRQPRVSAI